MSVKRQHEKVSLGEIHRFLATVRIYIYNCNGIPHKCRAILDSGSQSNFITKELSTRLHSKQESINTTIIGINHSPVNAIKRTSATIESRVSSFQIEIPFLIINKIMERLPIMRIDKDEMYANSRDKARITRSERRSTDFAKEWKSNCHREERGLLQHF
ncbi:hypothetical protein ALC57_06500 [Trachymyrmex cornetzi]|uniref:Uncharacterized protein n=1 Tax=Trachymyrmex cornetzi TaxID=471704 RepID=A0A151J8D8_9HYME|nr:hypothetical protein ALC57_06500 [Trachymyrmex cornetzi]